jgi:hypothetical protein
MTPSLALLALACASAPTQPPERTGAAEVAASPAVSVEPAVAAPATDGDPSAAFPATGTPLSMEAWSTDPTAVIGTTPESAAAMVTRGLLLRDNGDLSGARTLFEEAGRVAPADGTAALERARTLVMMRGAGPAAICGMGVTYEEIFTSLGLALTADPGLRSVLGDDPLLQPLLPLYRFRALLGVDMSRSPGADGLIVYGPPSGVWGSTRKVALLPDGRAAVAEFAEKADGSRDWTYQTGTWSAAGTGWAVAAGDEAWTLQPIDEGHFSAADGTWSDAASECGA